MSRPTYHQDYIARIRYSNALPPPPCPPKLLEIPNTGLSSGQYTSAGFASRLAREQPLNIEADAELGMPIDLVGIPGVFDGNEKYISALDNPPQMHPHDRALMRPPNALGKPASHSTGVSFLRRTEYITSVITGSTSRFESSSSTNTMRVRGKRRRTDLNQDDPTNIIRHIEKGFNLAYPDDADVTENGRAAEITPQERQAWNKPKHPSGKDLRLVESYPLLPDWEALPDTGNYVMYKFQNPPTTEHSGKYDERLDVGLLRPAGETLEDHEEFLAEVEKQKEDPNLPVPFQKWTYEFFLPPTGDKQRIRGIKRHLATNDPDNEDEIEFDEDPGNDGEPAQKRFRYSLIRNYETSFQAHTYQEPYGEYIALALHDPEHHEVEKLREGKLQKAAYFYPVAQRTTLRPKRPGVVPMHNPEDHVRVDIVDVVGVDPRSDDVEKREKKRREFDPEAE
ncbi:Paf1-domain-containing protein [Delitschia confertaspora ATCC 74209]|uniref:Paf1-domain-containing protein n=1 Tax=Delitschia confertaspora ATCC 74209 TaxID=1513339 RepID=A0A9P4JGZ2_9PLEO|nr:Paf1-domain-containing protein [Delitschia confertaspora ATCC 74209]